VNVLLCSASAVLRACCVRGIVFGSHVCVVYSDVCVLCMMFGVSAVLLFVRVLLVMCVLCVVLLCVVGCVLDLRFVCAVVV